MVCALTKRHWLDLLAVTEQTVVVKALEGAVGRDFALEDDRFEYREVLAGLLSRWFSARPLADVQAKLAGTQLLWSTYNTFTDLVADDVLADNPMMAEIDQPGVGAHMAPGLPMALGTGPRLPVGRAPVLGEHTDEVLGGSLGISDDELADLKARGVVA
jgi:2-methylfumaryl-CoA isomerase